MDFKQISLRIDHIFMIFRHIYPNGQTEGKTENKTEDKTEHKDEDEVCLGTALGQIKDIYPGRNNPNKNAAPTTLDGRMGAATAFVFTIRYIVCSYLGAGSCPTVNALTRDPLILKNFDRNSYQYPFYVRPNSVTDTEVESILADCKKPLYDLLKAMTAMLQRDGRWRHGTYGNDPVLDAKLIAEATRSKNVIQEIEFYTG